MRAHVSPRPSTPVVKSLTVNQWHTRTIWACLADTFQVTLQELASSNLETLLDNLGSVLINAVVCSKSKDVIDSTAAIGWGTVLADVLDAPVAELTVGDDIDACQNLVDAWTLGGQLVTTNRKLDCFSWGA